MLRGDFLVLRRVTKIQLMPYLYPLRSSLSLSLAQWIRLLISKTGAISNKYSRSYKPKTCGTLPSFWIPCRGENMARPSLSVNFLGLDFVNPFMNAAGVLCRTAEDLSAMTASASGGIITKSCTVALREGNPEPRYRTAPHGSINSMGLPNLGFDFYVDFAKQHEGRPLFVSVSGMTMQDNVAMAEQLWPIAREKGFLMELNLSCPNVAGKPQVGYDFATMREYLANVSRVYEGPFGVKLPPYFDVAHFNAAADIFNSIPNLKFLTCVNSLGNGLMIDVANESVFIKPNNGFGGIGGRYILPTALANVHAFYKRCPEKLIVGCGGVYGGEEAFMHILAGASLVQVGTCLYEEGPTVFTRLMEELRVIMENKGYSSLSDFHGKLKTIS